MRDGELTRDDPVIEWLLDGDPVIRWQVMRDLLDDADEAWEAERRRTVESGWVAEMLQHQAPNGSWPKGRWTDAPWAPLLLVACGLPEDHPSGRTTTERMLRSTSPPTTRWTARSCSSAWTSAISGSCSGSARTS